MGWFVDKILVSILNVQRSTFTNDVIVVNYGLLTKYSFYSCSSSMSFFLLFLDTTPLQHCSRSSSTSFLLLILNTTFLPTHFNVGSCSSLTQLLSCSLMPSCSFLLLLSSLILFLLLFNVVLAFVP